MIDIPVPSFGEIDIPVPSFGEIDIPVPSFGGSGGGGGPIIDIPTPSFGQTLGGATGGGLGGAAKPEFAKGLQDFSQKLMSQDNNIGTVGSEGLQDFAAKLMGQDIKSPTMSRAQGTPAERLSILQEKTNMPYDLNIKSGNDIFDTFINSLPNTAKASLSKAFKNLEINQVPKGAQQVSNMSGNQGSSLGGNQMVPEGTEQFANLGSLSEKYESRGDWGTVAYDSAGGWSYGKYQIASKPGTLNRFIKQSEFKNQLNKYPVGSPQFNRTFKNLSENPAFQQEQQNFIQKTHYEPVRKYADKLGIPDNEAINNVLWSTGVQHGAGGARRILRNAYQKGMKPDQLIKTIYNRRAKAFDNNPYRRAVHNRFRNEVTDALGLLQEL